MSFPFAKQVFSIERIFTHLNGNPRSKEKIFGITSLTRAAGSPDRVLELNRGHWTIENGLHYTKDVSMGEDASRIRKGSGPRLMASFKNLIISLFKKSGIMKITEQTLNFALCKTKLFKFVGICNAIKN